MASFKLVPVYLNITTRSQISFSWNGCICFLFWALASGLMMVTGLPVWRQFL